MVFVSVKLYTMVFQWFSIVTKHWSNDEIVTMVLTIGLNGFTMVFAPTTIGPTVSIVTNHWSNDGMVKIHRYGLNLFFYLKGSSTKKFLSPKSHILDSNGVWYS